MASRPALLVEVAAGGATRAIELENAPATVGDLRKAIALPPKADLVFVGGKKLKDSEALPVDATGRVKVRAFGVADLNSLRASASTTPSSDKAAAEQTGKGNDAHSSAAVDSISAGNIKAAETDVGTTSKDASASISMRADDMVVSIKGLSSTGIETNVIIKEGATFADVKRAFVSAPGCEVSDWRSVKFIGKGGKTPADEDKVTPGLSLRAFRSERGHDERAKTVERKNIELIIRDAEGEIIRLRGRLYDQETTLLKTRELLSVIHDAKEWLKANGPEDLLARAIQLLNSLESI